MSRLLQLFIDICLFRARPQDLPASPFLLLLCIVVSIATGFIPVLNHLKGVYPALAASLMDTGLILLFLRGGLYFLEKEPRFLQTATAIFGSGAVINIPLLVLELMFAAAQSDVMQAVATLLFLLLVVWSLLVLGHILRYALDIRFAGGVAIALGYFILISLLVNQFLPPNL